MLLKRGGNVMEKTLELIKEDLNYVIKDPADSSFEIKLLGLKIDSKEIFDKILKNSCDDKSFKFNISTKLTEKEDKIIFDQLKMLLSKIEISLNELFSKDENSNY